MSERSAWRAAYDDLHETLVKAQAERDQRGWFKDGEFGWMTHEREVMADRTNLLRSRRGLPPVSIEDVRRKEQLACSHVDYTKKWALGCADLVVEPVRVSPA